jgi:hypothetical protein
MPLNCYSIETLRDLPEGSTSCLLDMVVYMVDVRDCARMHIAVMSEPSTTLIRKVVSTWAKRSMNFSAESDSHSRVQERATSSIRMTLTMICST